MKVVLFWHTHVFTVGAMRKIRLESLLLTLLQRGKGHLSRFWKRSEATWGSLSSSTSYLLLTQCVLGKKSAFPSLSLLKTQGCCKITVAHFKADVLAENPFCLSNLALVPCIPLPNKGYLHGKRAVAPLSLFAWLLFTGGC